MANPMRRLFSRSDGSPDVALLARHHATADYVGDSLAEPGAAFLLAETVSRARHAFLSREDVRDGQARHAAAVDELRTAEAPLASAEQRPADWGTGVAAQAARRECDLRARGVRQAQQAERRLDGLTRATEHAALEAIGGQVDLDLTASLRRYHLLFNLERADSGRPLLDALPDDLVQRVVREAVRPVLEGQVGSGEVRG